MKNNRLNEDREQIEKYLLRRMTSCSAGIRNN